MATPTLPALHLEVIKSAPAVEFINPGEHDGIFLIARSIGPIDRPAGATVERFALRRVSSKGVDQEDIVALSDMLRPVGGDRLIATLLGRRASEPEIEPPPFLAEIAAGIAQVPPEVEPHSRKQCGFPDHPCPLCEAEVAERAKAQDEADARRVLAHRKSMVVTAIEISEMMRAQPDNPAHFGMRADPTILAAVIVSDRLEDIEIRLDKIEDMAITDELSEFHRKER